MRGIAFSRLLMLVVLVPLVGLAIFGARLTYDSWARYGDLSRASSVLRLAVTSARFAGIAVPGEGGLNRDMILGRADRSQIEPKRRVTDEVFRELHDAGAALAVDAPRLQAQLRTLEDNIRGMIALRPQIDANALKSPNDSTKHVTPAASGAVDLVGAAAAVVDDAVLSRRIFALYATIQFIQTANGQRGPAEIALKGTVLPADAYLGFARNYSLNLTFNKLFHDYAPAAVVATYDAFDAANGRELGEMRRLAVANSGQAASAAQLQRWLELNDALTALTGKMLVMTADLVDRRQRADAERGVARHARLSLHHAGGAGRGGAVEPQGAGDPARPARRARRRDGQDARRSLRRRHPAHRPHRRDRRDGARGRRLPRELRRRQRAARTRARTPRRPPSARRCWRRSPATSRRWSAASSARCRRPPASSPRPPPR